MRLLIISILIAILPTNIFALYPQQHIWLGIEIQKEVPGWDGVYLAFLSHYALDMVQESSLNSTDIEMALLLESINTLITIYNIDTNTSLTNEDKMYYYLSALASVLPDVIRMIGIDHKTVSVGVIIPVEVQWGMYFYSYSF